MNKESKKTEVNTVAKAKENVTRVLNVRGAVGVLLKSHRLHSTSWFCLIPLIYIIMYARIYGCRSPTNRAGSPHGVLLEIRETMAAEQIVMQHRLVLIKKLFKYVT